MSDSGPENIRRRLPIGAEILSDGEIHFRVWAPCSQKVEVIIGAGAKNIGVIFFNWIPARSGDLPGTWSRRTTACCRPSPG